MKWGEVMTMLGAISAMPQSKVSIRDNQVIWDPVPPADARPLVEMSPLNKFVAYGKYVRKLGFIIDALTRPNGPWAKEDELRKAVNTAVSFQRQLDITLENLTDLEEALEAFDSGRHPDQAPRY